MPAEPKDFQKWIDTYSAALNLRATNLLKGKYGAWLVSAFNTYDDFFKKLDGTAHANAYLEERSSSNLDTPLKGPAHKVRADQLMALARDMSMYRQTRLSFYRSHIARLRLTQHRLALVAEGLTVREKVATISANVT